jgi:hypothetical protein
LMIALSCSVSIPFSSNCLNPCNTSSLICLSASEK